MICLLLEVGQILWAKINVLPLCCELLINQESLQIHFWLTYWRAAMSWC